MENHIKYFFNECYQSFITGTSVLLVLAFWIVVIGAMIFAFNIKLTERNKHYHELAKIGKRCNQFTITEDYIQMAFEITIEPKLPPTGCVAVDSGINVLASVSTQEQYGTDVKKKIYRIKRCKHGSKGQQRARRALKQYIDITANPNSKMTIEDAMLKAREGMKRPEVEVRKAPDKPDLDGTRNKTQNVLESGNQRMADAQRRHADALHSQAMQNADTEHKHSLAYMIERAKKERELNKEIYLDKFRAQQIELQTSAESSQRSTDTEFAKSVFSAKSGTERMQAAAQYQFDTQYNAQKTQLEQKHAAQTEEQEKQGATEAQKAQLKQQQARELGELDQTKSFRDAIVGALGGTGSLRDVAREQGIGQKSGLMEAHERIKASAFGHIKDPVADAVKNMEREQTMQHVQLMNFLIQTAPNMISAMQRQGNAMTVQTYNNTYQNGFLT